MIKLLEQLRDDINNDREELCELESNVERVLPDIRLTPRAERWAIDNLGNKKSKEINFDVTVFIDNSDYSKDLNKGNEIIDYVIDLLDTYRILAITGCLITYKPIEELGKQEINANIDIILYSRR